MKRLLKYVQKTVIQLTVVVFVLAGNMAKAQYPYEFSLAGNPYDTKTIVRSYDHERVVVYYEDVGVRYVALVNVISNAVHKVQLSTDYVMNDMCIMNDSVFLCGRRYYFGNNVGGCIIAMNIDSFYTSSVRVEEYSPSYWMNLNLKRIKNFEYVYGSYNLRYAKFLMVADIEYACDGSEPFPTNLFPGHFYTDLNDHSRCTANAVVEVSYPFTRFVSNSPTIQKVIRFMNPLNHSEIIHDVVVTDNYVAFVGIETETTDYITLHICNRGDNILNGNHFTSTFNNYYKYPLGTGNGSPFYHACALDGDNIAIVTQDELSTSSNDITIRTFDLTTHTMTNKQYLLCNTHPYFKDVAYIPDLRRLVLLYHGYFQSTGNFCDIFCTVDPYGSGSYMLPAITDNVFHIKFNSLDAMKGGYFISTGGKFGLAADASMFAPGKMCYDEEDRTIVSRELINAVVRDFNYDQHLSHPAIDSMNVEPTYMVLPTACIEH